MLSEKNRVDRLNYARKNCDKDTVITIVEGLLKLFKQNYYLNFKHLLNFKFYAA